MNKDLFRYILVFVLLFLIGFYTHQFLMDQRAITLRFSLEKNYLFHAFFSAVICINLRLVATVDKLFFQIGFIYLGMLFVKLILFGIFIYKPISIIDIFTNSEKIALIIPLFVFLLTEVIFVAKILNRKDFKIIQ